MSDRNPEAVQFLKSLNIKASALGGFNKRDTFATLEQLSNIYEAALEAQRAEYLKKEAALQQQQQAFSAQLGDMLLQQEQDRRAVLAQANAEAARIVAAAKDAALRTAAQATGSLEQTRKEKAMVIDELTLIREQINQLLDSQSAAPSQPATPETDAHDSTPAQPQVV